jgi:hypothetical protein
MQEWEVIILYKSGQSCPDIRTSRHGWDVLGLNDQCLIGFTSIRCGRFEGRGQCEKMDCVQGTSLHPVDPART